MKQIENATTTATKRPDFETVKRNYEKALASGKDSTAELTALATAVAYSVINKCLDPQRKTATDREEVSDNGNNPAMLDVKRGIARDLHILENTRTNTNNATAIHYSEDGDLTVEVVDKSAEAGVTSLIGETLSDGVDLVNAAIVAILEQAKDHAGNGGEWLDSRYTVSRLSKHVYIQSTDSAAYHDVETTPIQEIYRKVRRTVQNSRAVQTDPRNGYCYIEDLTADGLETIYHRLGKYADLGGYDCNGNYTADKQTAADYDTLIAKLDLTDRQATIIKLRMQGRGYKQIATYLGVSYQAVQNALAKVQKKAIAIGLTPDGLTDGE